MKILSKNLILITSTLLIVSALFGTSGLISVQAAGPASVDLLTAGNFVILSKTGITDVPTSSITGNIGTSPITGASIGVTCAEVTGIIYTTDAAGPLPCSTTNASLLTTAVSNMETAYTDAAGRTSPTATELGAGNIGGMTLTPGLYKWSTDVTISANLTLSGSASDIWVFQIAGDLNIASAKSVLLSGGARASNIFWQVGGLTGATLGTTAVFNGTILSAKQIIMQTGAVLYGRALAQTQVTLDHNTISTATTLATLHVEKVVVNNNSGTALASAFNLHVKLSGTEVSGSPAVGVVSPGRSYTLTAGTYVISEEANALYTTSFSGDCNSSGSITLAPGDDKICTVTNDDIAVVVPTTGTINVVKTVINDNGRTKTVADFPLFVSGTLVISGETNTFSAPATYTITETVDSNYTQTFSGDCNASGSVSLVPGDSKFCIITNNDIAPTSGGGGGGGGPAFIPSVPPLIDVVKVPYPLALPAGPGSVVYTYTLRNIGTVPVTNITMVGDTCSPIALVSGDTNNDAKLDVNEIWVHNCTAVLAKTHTNTVVATGWANGLSATDIASATVVVGVSVVPPLIHVTQIPNLLVLTAGKGIVNYTEEVTNPGTMPLSNVRLTDDKCTSLKYISGDSNGDSKLDTTEAWVYTCQTTLTKTTTSTAVATGEANGLTVRDLAISTVVVSGVTPKLPNTGLAPVENSMVWPAVVISASIVFYLLYVIWKKQNA